jgi:hypothetical protein
MDEILQPFFLQWEEEDNFIIAIEKERFYLQGVKDGGQLLYSLLDFEPDKQGFF